MKRVGGQAADGTVAVGQVTTAAPGAAAAVVNAGTPAAAVLDFTIPRGDPGVAGQAGTVAVGAVTTGAAGSAAAVTNAGTPTAAVLDFTIPRGEPGTAGVAATIAVGTVTTGAPGSNAAAANAGTPTAAVLNLTIPRGDPGAAGAAATVAVGQVTTGAAGSAAGVANAGTPTAAVLNLTIPRGDPGAAGTAATVAVGQVTALAAGAAPTVTNAGSTGAAILDFGIPAGAKGADAVLPGGGTTGQALVKNTAAAGDTGWASVMQWRGAYNPATTYVPQDVVVYNGAWYLYIAAAGSGVAPTDTGTWRPTAAAALIPAAKTAAYTAAAGELVLADATTAAFTVTLPASPTVGAQVGVRKTDAGANKVTISGAGSLVDPTAAWHLTEQHMSSVFLWTGATVGWVQIGGSNLLRYRGEHVPGTQYGPADIVMSAGCLYKCIAAAGTTSTANPNRNTTLWAPLTFGATKVRTMAGGAAFVYVGEFVLADATTGNTAAWLPTTDLSVGAQVTLRKVDASANTVFFNFQGMPYDAAITHTLTQQGQTVTVLWTGPTASGGVGWVQVGAARATRWRGAWASGSTFYRDDLVAHGGQTWVCVTATQSANSAPPSADWALQAEQTLTPIVKSGAYNPAAPGDLVLADATTAAFTVTLPAGPPVGSRIGIRKVDTGSNAVTVSGNGAVYDPTLPWQLTEVGASVIVEYTGATYGWVGIGGTGAMRWRGAWSSTLFYGFGDLVSFDNIWYRCTSTTGLQGGSRPAANTASWAPLTFGLTWPYVAAAAGGVDGGDVALVDASGGPVTITLQPAIAPGTTVSVKKTDASSNAVTIATAYPYDPQAPKVLTRRGDSVVLMLQSVAAGWVQVGGVDRGRRLVGWACDQTSTANFDATTAVVQTIAAVPFEANMAYSIRFSSGLLPAGANRPTAIINGATVYVPTLVDVRLKRTNAAGSTIGEFLRFPCGLPHGIVYPASGELLVVTQAAETTTLALTMAVAYGGDATNVCQAWATSAIPRWLRVEEIGPRSAYPNAYLIN